MCVRERRGGDPGRGGVLSEHCDIFVRVPVLGVCVRERQGGILGGGRSP